MLRSLALLAIIGGAAHAGPDLRACADRAIAAAPDKQRAQLTLYLHGPSDADWADREKYARAQSDPLTWLLFLAQDAADLHDRKRAAHFADAIETAAKALAPTTYEPDLVKRESVLAQAQALAGRSKEAHAHLAAGQALAAKLTDPVDSVHRELWIAALVMQDPAEVAREQKAFLASRRADLKFASKMVAYAGAGRAIRDLAVREGVVPSMLEGVIARGDVALLVDLVKEVDARTRFVALRDARIGKPVAFARDPAFVAAVKAALAEEPTATVDDFARDELVEVATDVGLAAEARPVTTRIGNPWERAHAEARIATGLALTDKHAAIELAHAAIARAKTKGARKDVINDTSQIDGARWQASIALARAGAIAEAKALGTVSPIDELLGVRDDPKALAAWWKRAAPEHRAYAFVHAGDPWFGDGSFLAAFCTD